MDHVSTLKLHQLRYGELNPEEASRVRAHLQGCPRCASRLQAQEAHRAAFVLEPVPEALRAAPRPSLLDRLRGLWPALGALAAAAALWAVLVPSPADPVDQPEAGLRFKGAAVALEAWRDTPSGPAVLDEGDAVAAGDRVQLRYSPGEHAFVTFAGLDASGEVEIYGTVSAPGDEGAALHRAPFALTLDDTPGAQVFVALFTATAPSKELTTRVVQGRTAVPDGTLRKITLHKR